jgi:hypothetical protein
MNMGEAERLGRPGSIIAERDQLRDVYEALKIQVELAHRRLTIAKAERIGTLQLELELELELAATLAKLDELADLEKFAEADVRTWGITAS